MSPGLDSRTIKFTSCTTSQPQKMSVSQSSVMRKCSPLYCLAIISYKNIRYEKNELKHEDVFNYVDADGKVKAWPPTSDSSFTGFKKIMKMEWDAYKKKQNGH